MSQKIGSIDSAIVEASVGNKVQAGKEPGSEKCHRSCSTLCTVLRRRLAACNFFGVALPVQPAGRMYGASSTVCLRRASAVPFLNRQTFVRGKVQDEVGPGLEEAREVL